KFPEKTGEVALAESVALKLDVALGEQINITYPSKNSAEQGFAEVGLETKILTLVGVTKDKVSLSNAKDNGLLFAEDFINMAAERAPSQVSYYQGFILLELSPGANPEKVL